MTAPTLVLVHGAWHGSWCWDRLRAELTDVDVRTVDLPSSGPDPATLGDLAADAAAVRAVVDGIDGPAVVLGHSYGGVPITEALADAPNVTRLIYLAAVLIDAGMSVEGLLRGNWPDWWDVRVDDGVIDPVRPVEMLYGGVAPDVAASAVARLGHQSLSSMSEELTVAAWRTIPTTYLICEEDLALATVAQERMARDAGRVHRLPGAHSPFLFAPAAVAELLRRELAEAAP